MKSKYFNCWGASTLLAMSVGTRVYAGGPPAPREVTFPLHTGGVATAELCGGESEPCCADNQCHTGVCNSQTLRCTGDNPARFGAREITRTIPIRVVEIHAKTGRYIDNRLYTQMAAATSRAYRRAGAQFYIGSIESYVLPILGGTDRSKIAGSKIAGELTTLFPTLDSRKLKNKLSPRDWVFAVTTLLADDDVMTTYIFERETAIAEAKNKSTGSFPDEWSMVTINKTDLEDGTLRKPSWFTHEGGHMLGLEHPWSVHDGGRVLPLTKSGDQEHNAGWWRTWDMVYADGPEFYASISEARAAYGTQVKSIQTNQSCGEGSDSSLIECKIGAKTFTSSSDPAGEIAGLAIPTGVEHNPPFAYAVGVNALTYRSYMSPRSLGTRLISQAQAELVFNYLHDGRVELVQSSKNVLQTNLGATTDQLYTRRHKLGVPNDRLRPVGGKARAVAGGIDGDVWILGHGSGRPFKYSYADFEWKPDGSHAGVEIAVRGHNEVWLLKANGTMMNRRGPHRWKARSGCARDIAGSIGVATSDKTGKGVLWAVGCDSRAPHYWTGRGWKADGALRLARIAVAGVEDVWAVEIDTGHIYRREHGVWRLKPGAARDIAGASNGQVWMLGRDTGYAYIWDRDRWVLQSHTQGRRLTLDSLGAPWVIADDGTIYGLVR